MWLGGGVIGKKVYRLVNKTDNIHMTCTEKYLLQWIARGFEIEEIEELQDE